MPGFSPGRSPSRAARHNSDCVRRAFRTGEHEKLEHVPSLMPPEVEKVSKSPFFGGPRESPLFLNEDFQGLDADSE
jgi:hypothetical protein